METRRQLIWLISGFEVTAAIGAAGFELTRVSPITDRDGYAVLVLRDPDNIQLELISMG